MPTFEVKTPVGANQIWMKQQIRDAMAEATKRGKLRPNSVDSLTGENSGNNLGPGTPIVHFEQWERDDDRSEAHSQGRRLREHERAVLRAHRAAAPGPRRSHTSKACASASCTRCGTRRAKAARPARSEYASAAIAPPGTFTPRSNCSARSTMSMPIRAWPTSKPRSCARSTRLVSGPWDSAAACRSSAARLVRSTGLPASFFVSVAYDCWAFRRLGVVARCARRHDRSLALSRSCGRDVADDGSGRLSPHRARSRADHAARRGDDSLTEGWRRRDAERARLHRSRRGSPSSRQPRAARRSTRRGHLSLRPRGGERGGWLARDGGGTDHEHSRRTVSGRHHPQVRRAGGHGKRRDGNEDARRA